MWNSTTKFGFDGAFEFLIIKNLSNMKFSDFFFFRKKSIFSFERCDCSILISMHFQNALNYQFDRRNLFVFSFDSFNWIVKKKINVLIVNSNCSIHENDSYSWKMFIHQEDAKYLICFYEPRNKNEKKKIVPHMCWLYMYIVVFGRVNQKWRISTTSRKHWI